MEAQGKRGLEDVAARARAASHVLGSLSREAKDAALVEIARELEVQRLRILEANREDKRAARDANLSSSLQKRLNLEGDKFETLLQGISDVVKVADPVGRATLATELDEGLDLYRVTCPIGVLCIIFESRPEAAVQIASLAIKSSNAVILKGGKEALRSNMALVAAFRVALDRAGLPADAVQLVSTREDIHELLQLDRYIDLVIPRGSNQLVRSVMDSTKIPVMGHADGICSVYVDRDADLERAVHVVVDSKTQYTAACNAAETLLVHADCVETMLPVIGEALMAAGVKLHADADSLPFLPPSCTVPATEEDFVKEYLGLEMAVKVVQDVQAAIEHINLCGSQHTDAIVTENGATAELFMQGVGSAGVFHNASTRFADGFRFGFGAEVGVSTNRIHARGPVGLEGLVIYKYRLHGHGQCVKDYGIGAGMRAYKHRKIRLMGDDPRAPRLDAPPASICVGVGVGGGGNVYFAMDRHVHHLSSRADMWRLASWLAGN
ncbi:Delta-1-pyrroline-5-carboxylate synthase [Hondaea fermentalgiana]|uniref:glutamate-5-semialdehyde dehydrogenase n=1 Tax=Hondaea fermentalgiana TaxID=2315210 RepID=A0A2R5GZT0_9STRA|nr:Delta-1-pyrroline-5-carboxylate synthase [Hondaea fermentalgiana]|eukprot:GBG34283.1 Delta-1-pyrroline-5-carboxylate synthase [Hondaea fermentalgiana]